MRPAMGATVFFLVLMFGLNSAIWNPGPTCKRRYPAEECELPLGDGWFQMGPNYCIKVFKENRNFKDAEEFCRESATFVEGHLVAIHNIKEFHHTMCTMYRDNRRKVHYWIGLFRAKSKNGRWYWYWTDKTRGAYIRWNRGEPNNYKGREHCTEMNFR
ncbi:uncharacterized protein V6R79_006633, partial [Siganus canaliculatus]